MDSPTTLSIRMILKRQKVTQQELADRAGVKLGSVSNLLAKGSPTVTTLGKYLSLLGYRVALVPEAAELPAGSFLLEETGVTFGEQGQEPPENESEPTPEPKPARKRITTSSRPAVTGETYESGTYIVGSDLPAGEYVLVAKRGPKSGYWCVYTDLGRREPVGNSLFESFEYVSVSKGEVLEVSGATLSSSGRSVMGTGERLTRGGRVKVGKDIPSGVYLLTQTGGDFGYYAIYESSRPGATPVQSNCFENREYAKVERGQYLEWSNSTVERHLLG